MSEPFLSEIRIMSFNFPPKGWAECSGQLLPINQNQALFALLGTTYGGDGRTTFALPNLQGRAPIHFGSGHTLGEGAGELSHTLTLAELPEHTHVANASGAAAEQSVATNAAYLGVVNDTYGAPANLVAMSPAEIGTVGGSQAHQNTQPFLTLNFCIALVGIFPSPN
jgi:microcystin-dependent protein